MILAEINAILKPLVAEIKQAQLLDLQIHSLQQQVKLAKDKLRELSRILQKEEEDVMILNQRMVPVRKARFDREQSEYQQAKYEYQEALYMTSHLNQLLKTLEHQRDLIGDPEQLHADLIQLKEQTIVSRNHPALPLLLEREEKILYLEVELREVHDAVEAVKSAHARVDHLFRHILRVEGASGIFWIKERRKWKNSAEEMAFELHQANHKVLRELLDLKRTYKIANGDRMKSFYSIFVRGVTEAYLSIDEQLAKGKILCRSQVHILNEIQRSLLFHQKDLQSQIQLHRNSQKNIIEHA